MGKESSRGLSMKALFLSLLAALVFSIIPTATAQEFSADVVYTAVKSKSSSQVTSGTVDHTSKLYVRKDIMRLETQGFTGTVLLVDGSDHSALALFPARRGYEKVGNAPSEFFSVQDPENACPDWSKASSQKIACEKIGREVVGGRQTVKYQNKDAKQDSPSTIWIDSALKFVLKWQAPTTMAELHNIKDGPQPAELFTVPVNFTVLQPRKAASKGFAKR
jgi:hypothetical protein